MVKRFSEVFDDMLREHKLTQSKVVSACDGAVSAPALSRLARDERFPSREMVMLLCHAMKLERHERVAMYISAGFVPTELVGIQDEPEGLAFLDMLTSPDTPEPTRARLREIALRTVEALRAGTRLKESMP